MASEPEVIVRPKRIKEVARTERGCADYARYALQLERKHAELLLENATLHERLEAAERERDEARSTNRAFLLQNAAYSAIDRSGR